MPSNEADIRNAALEAAAALCESWCKKIVPGELPYGMAEGLAMEIRALKSDAAPAPEPKPFTFADPSAQREHERHREAGLRARKAGDK